jgi:glycosyltransferase involved in cell wall biosynthesis
MNRAATLRSHRIALVTPAFPENGGTTSVTRFLYEALAASPHYDPFIVSLATSAHDLASFRLLSPRTWSKGPVAVTRECNGIQFVHVGAWVSEIELLRYRPRRILNRILRGSDLIQVVSGSPAWAQAVSRTSIPTALQVATLFARERRSRFRVQPWGIRKLWMAAMTWMGSRIERKALIGADLIFVENRFVQRVVRELRGSGSVVFAPPGVDVSVFRPAEQPSMEGPILTVGRLKDPRKNVRLLLDAYARVRATREAVPNLLLVGELPSKADMMYAESLNLGGRIELRPDLGQSDLVQVYRDASIFVLSSDEEGLGLVVLEAMASGLPVIATRCGGPEMLVRPGVTGFLTNVGDADEMANALIRMIDDHQLRIRMGAAARAVAVADFSTEVCARRFLNSYQQLLDPELAGT